MSERARTRRRHSTPSAFPLASTVRSSENSNAPRTDATVRSPTRTSPASAGLLQSRRHVDRIAGDERAALARLADDDLARVDADEPDSVGTIGAVTPDRASRRPSSGSENTSEEAGARLLCASRARSRAPPRAGPAPPARSGPGQRARGRSGSVRAASSRGPERRARRTPAGGRRLSYGARAAPPGGAPRELRGRSRAGKASRRPSTRTARSPASRGRRESRPRRLGSARGRRSRPCRGSRPAAVSPRSAVLPLCFAIARSRIRYDAPGLGLEQHVGRLDVPVDEPARVGRVERARYLPRGCRAPSGRTCALLRLEQLSQVRPST